MYKRQIELGSYSELINSLNAVFEPSLKSKNLSYLCYNTVEHDAILCDRTKIREILLNIISNSIKYTPEGGKISVKIEETPAPRKGFASYRITVKDNGIGTVSYTHLILYRQRQRFHYSLSAKHLPPARPYILYNSSHLSLIHI